MTNSEKAYWKGFTKAASSNYGISDQSQYARRSDPVPKGPSTNLDSAAPTPQDPPLATQAAKTPDYSGGSATSALGMTGVPISALMNWYSNRSGIMPQQPYGSQSPPSTPQLASQPQPEGVTQNRAMPQSYVANMGRSNDVTARSTFSTPPQPNVKKAQMYPIARPKKQSFLRRALPYALTGAGIAGAGYLGYKAMQGQGKPAITPQPQAPNLADNPYVISSAMRSMKPEWNDYDEFSGAKPSAPTTGDSIAGGLKGADLAAGGAGLLAKPALGLDRLVTKLPGGASMFGPGAKKLLTSASGYADTQFLPSLSNPSSALNKAVNFQNFGPKAIGKFGITPWRGLLGLENAQSAQHDGTSDYWLNAGKTTPEASPYADAAVKSGLGGLSLATAAMPGGAVTHGFIAGNKGMLDAANTGQLDQAGKSTQLADTMLMLHRGMNSKNPQEAAQAREAAKFFFTDPNETQRIKEAINPGWLRRQQMRNFGLTDGESFWTGEKLQNTTAIQALMNRMRQQLQLPQEQVVDL